MTSSSPKKPRITALTPSRSEHFPARPLLVGGLCAALIGAAGLFVAGRGGEERIAAAVRQPPAAPPAAPAAVEHDLVEPDLVEPDLVDQFTRSCAVGYREKTGLEAEIYVAYSAGCSDA